MYDKPHFTTDAPIVEFHDDADGIERTDDGETKIDWDEVDTVTVDNPPHETAFDSSEFYRLPATVARPIPQPYYIGGQDSDDDENETQTIWLQKPRDGLKRAAWSLDNRPWTMGHPDTGMVTDVNDVRGFWRGTEYVEDRDNLDSDLHIPVDDADARDYIEDHTDVSVGFRNRVTPVDDYDGQVSGDADGDGDEMNRVEGYQTDMYFDHCASVGRGRCPASKGCGVGSVSADSMDVDGQTPGHGHMSALDADEAGSFISQADITDNSDAGYPLFMNRTVDQPDGIHVADGTWFAVGPDEHPDESTEWPDDAKFPVDSCNDVEDAWNLRGTGDISIDESTLEARIKRAGEAHGCDGMPWQTDDAADAKQVADSAKSYSVCGARKEVMADREYVVTTDGTGVAGHDADCGCGEHDTDTEPNETDTNTIDMEFEIDDLSVDAALARVADRHDGIAERLDELRAAEEQAEPAVEAADELDTSVDELPDAVAMLDEQNDELQERVDELQRPKMEEDAEVIVEHTDRYGETAEEVIEACDEDPEEIESKRELVEDLAETSDEITANSGASLDGGSGGGSEPEVAGGYAKTPW